MYDFIDKAGFTTACEEIKNKTLPIDAKASGYHVLLDDLQGGVPFSELAVSSANIESSIIGQTFSFKVYGKNILYTKSDYSTVRCSSSVPSDNEDAFVLTPTDYTLTSVAYRVKKPLYLKNGESITVKGSYENPHGNTIGTRILANNYIVANTGNITDTSGDFELTFTAKRDYYDPINAPNDDIEILFYARVSGTTAYGPVTYKNVQIEHGDTATDYERAGYTYLSITPDSDPYIIPNEIIQRNGINNIYCNSGNAIVNAVRTSPAIKKIWDKLDELTAALVVSGSES